MRFNRLLPGSCVEIVAVIQARMKSSRCPGKVLSTIAGRPLLQYVVASLRRCRTLADVIVATSRDAQDDAIAAFCAKDRVSCVRGEARDVARRFRDLLIERPCEGFVRICADSPLLDHRLVEEAVARFVKQPCDLVTNVFPRTFPAGQSIEVVRTATYLEASARFGNGPDREHVTTYFYRHCRQFDIRNFEAPFDASEVHLAVDSLDDLRHHRRIVGRMDQPHWRYDWQQIVGIHHDLRRRPAPRQQEAVAGI